MKLEDTRSSATTLGWRSGLSARARPCVTASMTAICTARSGSAKSRGFSPCHTPSDAIFTFTVDGDDDDELDATILSVW